MKPGPKFPRPLPAVLALCLGVAWLANAAPLARLARRPADILPLLGQGPHAGECSTCHTQHGSYEMVYDHALLGPDDNSLCAGCHTVPWTGGSFGGTGLYLGSAHGSDPLTVWPGPTPPARVEAGAQNKCVNCHDPHGWPDAGGIIPALALAREEDLCLTCHDGSPAASNIRVEQTKPFRHPTQNFGDRHTGPLEALPSDFASSPINKRHAECGDCHNPHLARADRIRPTADEASKRLLGVSRVDVTNGPAGTLPTFTFIPGSDTLSTPAGDWQLCFKCHSSWTTQPSGQTDLARVLNPNNPSFHPVEATGANPGIAAQAFVAGWDASSRTPCGSCHGSDDPSSAGPHGSAYRSILKAPYDPAPFDRTMTSDEACFSCHAFDVYANPSAPEALRSASRFNEPAVAAGHAAHVGGSNVPCGACHVTHGSATLAHLLVTGRTPGIATITLTPTGGTCAPTCHDPETYNLNYVR